MARTNVTVKEFPDLVVAFLFDKLANPEDVVPDNEDFNKLSQLMKNKGMNSQFMKYYLSMDPSIRLEYKRLKKTFDSDERGYIVVSGRSEEIESEPRKLGKLAKKILTKIVASKKLPDDEKQYLIEKLQEDIDGSN